MSHLSVPIPTLAASRPRDWRGYIVPYFQYVPPTFATDKKVDFRIKDPLKTYDAIGNHKCGICGHALWPMKKIGSIYFIGGPDEIEQRIFLDPAMHKRCAEYALAVCPFLVNKDYKPLDRPIEGTADDVTRAKFRPAIGLYECADYEIVKVRGQQSPGCRPSPASSVKWS